MYDTLIRLLYRVIAPGHPRGHVRFDAVREEPANTLWIHTHGMSRWGLHEVEFVGVPYELRGYAHGLLFDIIGYMRTQKPILPDQDLGGFFVSESQPVYHIATARLVKRMTDSPHVSTLRFVDYKTPAESGFPRRLFAAHITALAADERSAARRETMFRKALELFPPGAEQEGKDPRENANNWVALEGLGTALCDLGHMDEGLAILSRAATASPRAMRSLAAHIRGAIASGQLPSPESDPRSRFWSNLGA
jgi:hypothetical protein